MLICIVLQELPYYVIYLFYALTWQLYYEQFTLVLGLHVYVYHLHLTQKKRYVDGDGLACHDMANCMGRVQVPLHYPDLLD